MEAAIGLPLLSRRKYIPNKPKLIAIPAAEKSNMIFLPNRSTIKGQQAEARTITTPTIIVEIAGSIELPALTKIDSL